MIHLIGQVLALLVALDWAPEARNRSLEPAPTRIQDTEAVTVPRLLPFPRPEWLTEEAFAALEADARSIGAMSKRRLVCAGRAAVPALINAMLIFDNGTKKGARRGRDCHLLLAELTHMVELPWAVSTSPQDVQANRRTVAFWHGSWGRCLEDPKEWWRLLKIKDGPVLDTFMSLGLPDSTLYELLTFQDTLQRLQAEYSRSVAPLEQALQKSEAAPELKARMELIASLPEQWEESPTNEGDPGPLAPSLIKKQLEDGIDIPWPLGMRDSLGDTLRTSKRGSSQNQRRLRVPELPEEIEVSVVTYGNSQYALIPLSASWATARRICEDNGGHLACIGTPEELNAVLECIPPGTRSHENMWKTWWDMGFWVGATDSQSEDEWVWLDGGRVDPSFWVLPKNAESSTTPQPNDGFQQEHCAALILFSGESKPEDPTSPSGESKLEDPTPPWWGLMDWLESFPLRFICEWGAEEITGPWNSQTLDLMRPFLQTYFATCFAGAEAAEKKRLKIERQTAGARTRLKKAVERGRKLLIANLEGALAGSCELWTPSQLQLAQRINWLVNRDRCFPEPQELGVPHHAPDAVAFLGRHYSLISAPATRRDAARACRMMGGKLATLGAGGEASNLLGGEVTAYDIVGSDPELTLFSYLLRDAGKERAWLGYQMSVTLLPDGDNAAQDRFLAGLKWRVDGALLELDNPWLSAELLRGGYWMGGNFAPGYSSGTVLEVFDSGDTRMEYVLDVSPRQKVFSLPFELPIPAQAVKLRVKGAATGAFQLGTWDATKPEFTPLDPARHRLGATCPSHLRWTGIPFTGEEEVVVYASPVTSAASHVRLPYICMWDS